MALMLWIGAGMALSIVSTVLALALLSRARDAEAPVPSSRAGGPDAAGRRHEEVQADHDRRVG